MLPTSKSFSLVRLPLAALVLMVAAAGTANARPDIRKAYALYKSSCIELEVEKDKFLQSVEFLEKAKAKFAEICKLPTDYLYENCRESARSVRNWHASAEYHARSILRRETECREAKRNYLTALDEIVTEALLTDPSAAIPTRRRSTGTVKKSPSRTRKPPTRRKSSVKKNRRRPPTRRQTTRDTQAAEFIGGLILFGLQQGIRSGSKRGGRGPGYIP